TVFDSGDAKIKVDEIREMRASAYISPNDGERKVYIICSADNMTQEAQDALLKILEEPPQFTAFILLCYNHNSLLSTVRSRVTHLKLAPLTDEEMDARLREHCQTLTDAERALRIAMAEGFFGRAINPDAPSDAVLQATAISDALATGNELKILESMILLERLPRDDLRMVLDALKVILHNIVTTGTDARGALKTESVLRLCEVADVGRALLVCNVGSAHVCGMLACKFYEAITRGGQAFD
ncbi:MAG: hypothetical protein RR994_06180, partial [Clostridia bacterium]